MGDDRSSQAEAPKLLDDDSEIARREVENGFRQWEATLAEIETELERGGAYRLRLSTILALHRLAVDGLEAFAGAFRPGPVKITKSRHVPPEAALVPELVEEMCDTVNDNWQNWSPIELGAYVLWRMCWIHPFTDGNGRTARALSYLVLNVAARERLSGTTTIPELIERNKTPYYEALEAADAALEATGDIDVAAMSNLFEALLAEQLLSALNRAKNKPAP
ncbi:Fic family protein [uncultured Algimonas sp.]|uniref:Fic family protein n=1 Tax=uncultured Algimonas sp. TaxID=1547920 RepID=UPI00260E0CDE|nr:Fic family protein [uncultured Algimonas sp.]